MSWTSQTITITTARFVLQKAASRVCNHLKGPRVIMNRLVKTPKVYLTETGILHHLIGVTDLNSLSGNLIVGSSWESFVINLVCKNLLNTAS